MSLKAIYVPVFSEDILHQPSKLSSPAVSVYMKLQMQYIFVFESI